jgi:hypothetical protein
MFPPKLPLANPVKYWNHLPEDLRTARIDLTHVSAWFYWKILRSTRKGQVPVVAGQPLKNKAARVAVGRYEVLVKAGARRGGSGSLIYSPACKERQNCNLQFWQLSILAIF